MVVELSRLRLEADLRLEVQFSLNHIEVKLTPTFDLAILEKPNKKVSAGKRRH